MPDTTGLSESEVASFLETAREGFLAVTKHHDVPQPVTDALLVMFKHLQSLPASLQRDENARIDAWHVKMSELDGREANIRDAEERSESLAAEIETQRQQITALCNKDPSAKIEQLSDRLVNMCAQNSRLAERLTGQQRQTDEYLQGLEEHLGGQHRRTDAYLHDLEDLLKGQHRRTDAYLHGVVERLEGQHRETDGSLQSLVEGLDLRSNTAAVDELRKERDTANSEVERLSTQLKTAGEVVTDLSTQLAKITEENTLLSRSLKEIKTALKTSSSNKRPKSNSIPDARDNIIGLVTKRPRKSGESENMRSLAEGEWWDFKSDLGKFLQETTVVCEVGSGITHGQVVGMILNSPREQKIMQRLADFRSDLARAGPNWYCFDAALESQDRDRVRKHKITINDKTNMPECPVHSKTSCVNVRHGSSCDPKYGNDTLLFRRRS